MASTIFHHWLDQFHALPKRRQRWIRGAVGVLVLAVVFAIGIAVGRGFGFPNGLAARAQALAARNSALQGELQSAQQQEKTANTALVALRATLASRDAEVQKLRQQQTLYGKLIGIDGDRTGLGVHGISLSPVQGTTAFNFVATLVNTAENADVARGNLTLAVEGVRGGKLVTLPWAELASPSAKSGVAYAFKFFQQVRGSFMLPKGFVPNRVIVTLHPDRGTAVTRRLDWEDAENGQGSPAPTP